MDRKCLVCGCQIKEGFALCKECEKEQKRMMGDYSKEVMEEE